MDPTQLTTEELAKLLWEAERAHGDYEKELGRRDEDWPTWYADYILRRLREGSDERPGLPGLDV
jgi:hypothetical protein